MPSCGASDGIAGVQDIRFAMKVDNLYRSFSVLVLLDIQAKGIVASHQFMDQMDRKDYSFLDCVLLDSVYLGQCSLFLE